MTCLGRQLTSQRPMPGRGPEEGERKRGGIDYDGHNFASAAFGGEIVKDRPARESIPAGPVEDGLDHLDRLALSRPSGDGDELVAHICLHRLAGLACPLAEYLIGRFGNLTDLDSRHSANIAQQRITDPGR